MSRKYYDMKFYSSIFIIMQTIEDDGCDNKPI